MYYTLETPPLFAVLSHGMAAVAFWRGVRWLEWVLTKIKPHFPFLKPQSLNTET